MKTKLTSTTMAIAMVVTLLATALPVAASSRAASFPVPAAAEVQQAPPTPIYLDTSYSFEERAADLISRMTLQEKASLMISSRAAAIPRLGVREYGWWNEALHGVARLQYNPSGNATVLYNTTSYPIDLSLGSSWDPELMYREAVMISDESREVVPDNVRNLDFWSPTINLSRDPRWGRNDESYGEDPFLTTQIVSQFVNGMEGKDMEGNLLPESNGYLKAITTLKHYAANNSEVNRRTGSANMDDRTLREYYTAAFKGIVQQADNRSVMTSYNRVNETPTSASVYLMDNLLRQTWGFTGYVTSDCDSVMDISQSHHWIPPGWTIPVDQTTRMAFAMSAGEDLNCNAGYSDGVNYANRVPTAVAAGITTETGLYTENDVDTSLLRLFTARMQLGEFDDALGLDVPWATQARARVPAGTWTNANTNNAITETPERVAMAREVGSKTLVLLKNSETTRKDGTTGKLLPLQIPASGPFTVAVVGYFSNPTPTSTVYQFLGGYSSNQGTTARPKHTNPYNGIRDAILAVNPEATVTYYKGFTGTGTSAASLITIDPAHVAAAAAADLAIVYVGSDAGTANEAGDRANITLPGAQAALIQQVAQANPNTIAVMETIGLMDVTTFEPYASAMLWSSYNGQQKGAALADVLTGAYNPSGRLPFIWYQSNSQLPPITDYTLRPTETNPGRTYMYFSGPLSYPFGHGLSYTDFTYANLQLSETELDANDSFQVSVDITNAGAVQGTEVVQLYVNTPDASAELERPIKRLRGFQKVSLEPGETKTVTLDVKVPDLAFFDEALGRYVVDNGRYGIQISKSSADVDILLQDFVNVSGTLTPVLNVVTVKPTQEGDAASDIPTRVLFDEGKIVIPQITVAMNDETLYGYIKKNGSRPLPEGMTVQYSSNRPEVVSIGADGLIRAVQSGVATVTATATYQGVSESTDFVIRVVADVSLSSIKVNGKPVSGFSPTVTSYAMLVPDGLTTVPQVEVTPSDPEAAVMVEQAAGVPGQAIITITKGYDEAVYTVAFGFRSASDEFDSGELGSQWSWIREDSTKWRFDPGSLVITPQQGDIQGSTTNTARNILLQNGFGDWIIESKLVFSVRPHVRYQQGGIIAYQDDDNYVKLGWEFASFFGTATRFVVITEKDGAATTSSNIPENGVIGSENTVWFRMVKSGNDYTTYYSIDGENFTLIGTTNVGLADVRVGPYAFNRTGTSSDLEVAYDYFHVTNTSEVVNVAPALSADPATQNVQYTDAIQPVTITATDLAEDLPFSATTQWSQDGGAFQPGLPSWLALTPVPCTESDPNATCTWTLQGTVPVQAGTFVVRTTISDNWLQSSDTDVIIVVVPEDAFIEYTGEAIAEIGKELALRATVWDSAASGYAGANPETGPGATIGDVTKMWIEFALYPANSCLTDPPAATLVAQVADGVPSDGIGTASATFTSQTEASYCVVAKLVAEAGGGVNQWYTAVPAEPAVITFYEPSGQFVTGGGWIHDPDGSKGNFGLNARYLKNGKPQGHMVYVYRGLYNDQPADFVIRSNALNALAFGGAEYPVAATLQGKATIQINRSSDGTLLYSEGNATFQATVVDTGANPGAGSDSFALTLYDKNGLLYKSVAATLLEGGNVVIKP